MRVEWVADESGLAELAPAWEELEGPGALPFLRPAWFTAWWASFGAGRSLAVATAWEGERLAAVLPLARSGNRLTALANDHTPLFRPIGDAAGVEAVLTAAVRATSLLTLPSLTEGQAALAQLRASARAARRLLLVQDYQVQPVVTMRETWEAYHAALDKGFRKDAARRLRRAQEELALTQIVLETPSDPERQLTLGFAAEASGWKGERGTSIRDDPAAERFYRALAGAFGPEGTFRISALEVDGAYAAFDLSLIGGNRLWILKGGFDEQYRRFAPGIVLTMAQVERAHELGLDAVELLGQTVPWKQRFADEEREQVYAAAYGWAPAALARYGIRRARPLARAAYRRLPGRQVR